MKTGISIYLSSGLEKNEEVIRKAKNAGAAYGFTSLHIPEEDYNDYKKRVLELLNLAKSAGIELTMDVDGETPDRLGLKAMENLLDFGVTSIRLDYGFSDEDVVNLSKHFKIVWNASTISPFDIKKWERLGADVSRFEACHNYYPKPYTGLSLEKVKEINSNLKLLGYNVSAFIPGDKDFRGPLCQGLPTIEDHRNAKEQVALNMLQLYNVNTDIVMIGDVDLSDDGWSALKDLSKGYVRLGADLSDFGSDLIGKINHERPDSSSYIIRSQESRAWFKDASIAPKNTVACKPGSICIGNDRYLRYKGEIEICRTERPADERVNVIGQVRKEDLKYLPYICDGMGFVLV
ncbi:MupG family TIM beta-alpha barrel fold protein [Pseudobutyrivibrio sp.]|uniref:MupG family TIM beta-alpha barrel fold protein n=1 Tax=Pseudobutyrivibrio sp. TaxID=2014367 RepID=UPI001DC9FBD6|nr:MupG family TIM beta-alpha barrel fold protein [Pseudobutyrivibrio sp.]MBE5909931.1 DUF871 domain-containing protein [Pseudobutyrivibrio sp.]